MSLQRQTPPNVARTMTKLLVGDPDWTTPGGTMVHSYFAAMTLEDALEEFDQVHRLNEGDRLRDLLERLGEDGTPVSTTDC